MIGCDYCKEWYHFKCIGLKEEKTKNIKRFKCDACKEKARIKKQRKLEEEQMRMQAELARRMQASSKKYKKIDLLKLIHW